MLVELLMARAALANSEVDMNRAANLQCKLMAFARYCADLSDRFTHIRQH